MCIYERISFDSVVLKSLALDKSTASYLLVEFVRYHVHQHIAIAIIIFYVVVE